MKKKEKKLLQLSDYIKKKNVKFVIHVDEVQKWAVGGKFFKKRMEDTLKFPELKDYNLINLSKFFLEIKDIPVTIIFTGTSYNSEKTIVFGTDFKPKEIKIKWDLK